VQFCRNHYHNNLIFIFSFLSISILYFSFSYLTIFSFSSLSLLRAYSFSLNYFSLLTYSFCSSIIFLPIFTSSFISSLIFFSHMKAKQFFFLYMSSIHANLLFLIFSQLKHHIAFISIKTRHNLENFM